MVCPECGSRKARRQCPAMGRAICPTCCGTKRQVVIPCPDDCGWLKSAQVHPPASLHRQALRDREWMMALLAGLSDPEYLALTTALDSGKTFRVRAIPPPLDEDLRQAAGALAATAETALRGVIYEHQPDSLVAARLAVAMREALDEAGEPGRARDAAVAGAMRRIERGVRTAMRESADPLAFWDFLDRVLRPRVTDAGTPALAQDASGAASRSIILP